MALTRADELSWGPAGRRGARRRPREHAQHFEEAKPGRELEREREKERETPGKQSVVSMAGQQEHLVHRREGRGKILKAKFLVAFQISPLPDHLVLPIFQDDVIKALRGCIESIPGSSSRALLHAGTHLLCAKGKPPSSLKSTPKRKAPREKKSVQHSHLRIVCRAGWIGE